jgi:ATP-binding cassette subfamily B protein
MQKQILRLFWRYTRRHALERNLAIIIPVFAVTVNVIAAPYVLSLFIDRLQSGEITLDNSWGLITAYGALIFGGEVILWRLALYFAWTFQVKGQRDLYIAVFDTLSRQDMRFHANRFGGSLVSQSTKLVGSFERFWDIIVWSIIPMLTTVIGSVVTLSVLGLWQYALFLVAYFITFTVIVIISSRFLTTRNREEASASNKSNGYLADMVTNISTVKAFGKEDDEHASATTYAEKWAHTSHRLKWGVLGVTTAFSTMYALAAVAAFIFAVLGAQYGIASAGLVYLVFVYALNVNRQVWELNSITRSYTRVLGDADEMTKILAQDSDIVDRSDKVLVAAKGAIAFEDVDFTHDKGDGEAVFQKLNLVIPAGQRVGVVGHSGSGKTTLTRILLRFSDIDSGKISIDGQDIGSVTQKSLHESIAYVSQEPMLFHRTLHENIAYGKPDASIKEIKRAAELAHATDFIDGLKDGFDTLVGERGVKLSGGQRQRIAIARAILKDAPILVLDEATSALDSESEKMIQASLDDLMKGRTSIVIAHRLSTIAKLDRIIVLHEGTIVEDGTHDHLLKKKGTYANLWSHQSGGFIED